ncbi:MAG TPA: ADOP family duplicated permease [Acidobacteriaceae bacterium]|nr:ADOP family duplicated permease [Acidobacteriaceae bacterium]
MSWLQGIFSRRSLHSELHEEIESHISERASFLISQGMEPQEAERQARRTFGNADLATERSVEIWQFHWLESFWADVRFAFHQLRKSPGYTLTAVLTLAIGIGANVAIFTVIYDAMLRSLPIQKPAELVSIGYRSPETGHFAAVQFWPVMTELHGHLHGVTDLAGWSGSMLTVPDEQNTLRSIGGNLVTGNALTMLGIRPYLGRLLTPSDDVRGGPEGGWPVVLDYGFWLSNFHGDPAVIGKHLRISGQPAVIVGVLPQNFHGMFVGEPQKLFLPIHFLSALATTPQQDPFLHPEGFGVLAIARMAPGTTLASLNAQLKTMSPAMQTFVPARLRNIPAWRNSYMSAQSASRGFSEIAVQYSKPLLLIQGIVLAVLLLCCMNLAGLQTAKLQSRQHEFAIRSALGAGRWRILQQCLVEALMLAFLGSIVAAGLAWSSVRAISSFFTPGGSGESTQLQPDAHILVVTAALALLTTLLFGLVPAWLAGRVAPNSVLKSKGTNARRDLLRRRLFIPAQFSLALALVFAAGLFTHTLVRLRNNHAGFNPAHVMEVCAQFQALKKSPAQIMELYRSVTDFLRASPGVQSAAYTWVTPLTGFAPKVEAHSVANPQDRSIAFNEVGDGYFATIGTRVLAGREFTQQDRDRSICIVNQAAAQLLFPGGQPLDNSLIANYPGGREGKFTADCRVVGIVENARYSSLRDPAPPTVYFPAYQSTVLADGSPNNLVFFIRSQNAGDAISAYRGALARFAPTTGYMVFLPLSDQVNQSLGSERLIAQLSSAFAAIALLLSGVGLFGVLALRVQERRSEMGVRLAIGASRAHILGLVLRDALSMLAIGSLAGIVLIAATTAFTRRFLYDTSPIQMSVALGALLTLISVALLASLLPAFRAARLNPIQVLREE